jgi:hypothetical protein
MQNTAINGANYLSASQMASELRRNKVSVYRAIKRLRIPHAFELNGFKFYNRASLAKLEKGMRRRNGSNGHTNGASAL